MVRNICQIQLYFISGVLFNNFTIYFTGTLIVSPTVHLAFDETYYLERACKNVTLSLGSVGGDYSKLKTIPDEMVKNLAKYYNQDMIELYAKRHFYAYWNLYLEKEPDVFF